MSQRTPPNTSKLHQLYIMQAMRWPELKVNIPGHAKDCELTLTLRESKGWDLHIPHEVSSRHYMYQIMIDGEKYRNECWCEVTFTPTHVMGCSSFHLGKGSEFHFKAHRCNPYISKYLQDNHHGTSYLNRKIGKNLTGQALDIFMIEYALLLMEAGARGRHLHDPNYHIPTFIISQEEEERIQTFFNTSHIQGFGGFHKNRDYAGLNQEELEKKWEAGVRFKNMQTKGRMHKEGNH